MLRRLVKILSIALVLAGTASGAARAQNDPQATIDAQATRIADLEVTTDALHDQLNEYRSPIATGTPDRHDQVS